MMSASGPVQQQQGSNLAQQQAQEHQGINLAIGHRKRKQELDHRDTTTHANETGSSAIDVTRRTEDGGSSGNDDAPRSVRPKRLKVKKSIVVPVSRSEYARVSSVRLIPST